MDRLEEALDNTQKLLDELVRIYSPLRGNTSLDQNDGKKTKQPWEVKEGKVRGAKSLHLALNCNKQNQS